MVSLVVVVVAFGVLSYGIIVRLYVPLVVVRCRDDGGTLLVFFLGALLRAGVYGVGMLACRY